MEELEEEYLIEGNGVFEDEDDEDETEEEVAELLYGVADIGFLSIKKGLKGLVEEEDVEEEEERISDIDCSFRGEVDVGVFGWCGEEGRKG